MGELSRWEDLLKTGSEDTVKPLSRVEAILRDEDITPQSRIEKLLKEGGGGRAVLYDEYEITQNKTKIVPPVGYDGFSSVITNVPDPTLITKNVTTNGEFNAEDDNADGYSSFSVNVPQLFSKIELYQSEYDALTPAEKTDPSKFYVIKPGSPPIYFWDFTKSLVDEKQGVTAVLNGGATRDENGLHLQGAEQYCQFLFEDIVTTNKSYTFEMECGEFVKKSNNFQYTIATYDKNNGMYTFEYNGRNGWGYFNGSGWIFDKSWVEYNNSNIFNNKKISFIFGNSTITVKIDNTVVQNFSNTKINKIFRFVGNNKGDNSYYNMTIRSIKIYANEEV